MRKEVKLGFAIGGVLLSVLIVYVLVMSGGGERPEPVTLATSDSANPSDKPTTAPAEAARPAEEPRKDEQAKPAVTPEAQASDPFATPPTSAPMAQSDEPKKSSEADHWAGGVLQTGLPVLLTTTPQKPAVVTPTVASMAGPVEPNRPIPAPDDSMRSATGAVPNAPAPGFRSGVSPSTRPTNQPQSSSGPMRTHVVQSGETFSSIAAAAYGNSAYYAHLIRANPNVDPRKLRPGMVINVPPMQDVRADGPSVLAASDSSASLPKSDPKSEYKVQPGDNLFKIATKLYGKSDKADAIYDLNRTTIGDNPAKLKPGMVLKLPEAPLAKAQ